MQRKACFSPDELSKSFWRLVTSNFVSPSFADSSQPYSFPTQVNFRPNSANGCNVDAQKPVSAVQEPPQWEQHLPFQSNNLLQPVCRAISRSVPGGVEIGSSSKPALRLSHIDPEGQIHVFLALEGHVETPASRKGFSLNEEGLLPRTLHDWKDFTQGPDQGLVKSPLILWSWRVLSPLSLNLSSNCSFTQNTATYTISSGLWDEPFCKFQRATRRPWLGNRELGQPRHGWQPRSRLPSVCRWKPAGVGLGSGNDSRTASW